MTSQWVMGFFSKDVFIMLRTRLGRYCLGRKTVYGFKEFSEPWSQSGEEAL